MYQNEFLILKMQEEVSGLMGESLARVGGESVKGIDGRVGLSEEEHHLSSKKDGWGEDRDIVMCRGSSLRGRAAFARWL